MHRFGLITRIALLVVVIEIAAFSTLGWFYIDRFSRSIDERTRMHLQLVGYLIGRNELAVSSISNPSLMTDLIGAPYLRGMVIGGNGRVIVSTDSSQLGRLASELAVVRADWLKTDAEELYLNDKNTLTAVLHNRPDSNSTPIYTTVITISTAELAANKRNIALWGQLGSLLFILLTSSIIVWFAQRMVTRRVAISLKVMKQIESGDFNCRIPTTINDELGQMQAGINSLTIKIGELLHQHRRNEADIRAQSQLLDSIVENIPNMIFLKRASDLSFVLFNRAGEKLLGYDRTELLGKNDYDIFPKAQADYFTIKDRQVLDSSEILDFPEEVIFSRDGARHYLHTRKLVLTNSSGDAEYLLGISEEITERKRSAERITELAFYDQLTGLPNRTLLMERLQQSVLTNRRTEQLGALLFIDLDNFKMLNDTLGHDKGDLLLKQVALRLQGCVRAEDTVARVGGDEFLVLLGNLGGQETMAARKVEHVSLKILAELNQTYHLDDVAFNTSASLGATLLRQDNLSADEMLKQADLAMYKSKETGRNRFHFFNADMQSALTQRVALEKDLREALQSEVFQLYYQPQVEHGLIIGAEVLLRWQHPERGWVSPAEFVPVAEDTGLIIALGRWVLLTACRQLALWSGHPKLSQLTVAVNVSAQQFRQADFVEQVVQVIQETGVDPRRLKLELTESILVANVEDIVQKMQAIRRLGVDFSLDDFGTGYSSLSYLKRLPLAQLKIDQSFVKDMTANANNAAIAKTIVGLAHSLGLSVIAEGVETAGQRDFLASLGCHTYQGYLFSRPVPVEAFTLLALPPPIIDPPETGSVITQPLP